MKENQNKIYLPNQNQNNLNDNFLIDTIYFNVDDYPIFEKKYYVKYTQNIKKVFSELLFENNRPVYILHKIFISRDFAYNKTHIIQIDITYGDFPEQRLTNQKIDGCNIEILRSIIEKYNDVFNIDSTNWYFENKTTDIYVKSEIDYQNRINKFIMYYKKDTNNLDFLSTDFIGNHFSKGERTHVKPNEVVKIYNKFKSGFEIDNKPEIFEYYEEPVKIYNYNNNYNSNNNYNNNNNNNYNYSYSRQESNHSNHSNESDKSRRTASMKDRIGNNIGRVDRNGDIKDRIGNRIGNFASNGDIKDEIGNRIGNIDSNGDIKDRIGNNIGRVDSDGEVKDRIGNIIGRVDSNGDVKDRIGNIIGNAEGMDKEQAAYLYFFKD